MAFSTHRPYGEWIISCYVYSGYIHLLVARVKSCPFMSVVAIATYQLRRNRLPPVLSIVALAIYWLWQPTSCIRSALSVMSVVAVAVYKLYGKIMSLHVCRDHKRLQASTGCMSEPYPFMSIFVTDTFQLCEDYPNCVKSNSSVMTVAAIVLHQLNEKVHHLQSVMVIATFWLYKETIFCRHIYRDYSHLSAV